eukprot:TRINITY_DN11088_c0_g1_i4.p1 TRINITY_DN11088_c0_g1~~TRINITY_DN11088_c0_g1_i4.p1  ORF type:complete len:615 (-),score=59.10 TRINITY_DN11088_c0_g1_i4:108-1952(-)
MRIRCVIVCGVWGRPLSLLIWQKKTNSLQFYEAYGKLADRAVQIKQQITSSGISNILWSFGKTQWRSKFHVDILSQVAVEDKEYTSQAISNILWAFAILEYENWDVLIQFLELANKMDKYFKPQEISNILWALKKLRLFDEQLITLLSNRILNASVCFKDQEISSILLAFADFSFYNEKIVYQLVFQLLNIHENGFQIQKNKKAGMNMKRVAQALSNSVFALSILQAPVELSQKIVDILCFYCQPEELYVKHLCQLRTAEIMYEMYNMHSQNAQINNYDNNFFVGSTNNDNIINYSQNYIDMNRPKNANAYDQNNSQIFNRNTQNNKNNNYDTKTIGENLRNKNSRIITKFHNTKNDIRRKRKNINYDRNSKFPKKANYSNYNATENFNTNSINSTTQFNFNDFENNNTYDNNQIQTDGDNRDNQIQNQNLSTNENNIADAYNYPEYNQNQYQKDNIIQQNVQTNLLYLPDNFRKAGMVKMQNVVNRETSRLPNQFLNQVLIYIQGIYPVAKKRSRIFGGEFEVGIEIKIQGANNKIKGVAVQIAKEKNYMQNYPHQLIGSSQRYFELLQCLGWGVIVVFYMHWDKFWYREQIMEDIGKLLEQDDNQLLVVQLE